MGLAPIPSWSLGGRTDSRPSRRRAYSKPLSMGSGWFQPLLVGWALPGGERSFSTLRFALALHEMTEAPFRAMDEFDVFLDAVSRKINLDAVVDFALAQGSQWIFITTHDISMVKQDERVKKQQMAAPRS
ncbi:hypothetical protein RND71_026080 [Anisodus tanguticus]|uniref:RecF/RecN/SMC N-terminal domain-containing protein n=1 Tax=Anisodus tanguticus TaxID=243964 RepID=A0AAE1RMU7_9SOLA|nr:hypothetical protein RND71_026080 [Anisodus tanguticus]